jgi:hypothetical protein
LVTEFASQLAALPVEAAETNESFRENVFGVQFGISETNGKLVAGE